MCCTCLRRVCIIMWPCLINRTTPLIRPIFRDSKVVLLTGFYYSLFITPQMWRRSGLMVEALIWGSSGAGSSPGLVQCDVFWARHTVPLSNQVYKWGVSCDGLVSHTELCRNTGHFVLHKLGQAPAWWPVGSYIDFTLPYKTKSGPRSVDRPLFKFFFVLASSIGFASPRKDKSVALSSCLPVMTLNDV